MRYHSIALHAIMIFRPKCAVQVYILMFLSIRCYIKLICQLQVGSGGIVRDPDLDPDGTGTEFGKREKNRDQDNTAGP